MINKEALYQVLIKPVVSEKSSLQGDSSKIVFEVMKTATKSQIKAAIETLFSVKVVAVNTLLQKGKAKRFGRHLGARSDRKKAYITLEDSANFDVFDAEVR